jgi:hypothetical protein
MNSLLLEIFKHVTPSDTPSNLDKWAKRTPSMHFQLIRQTLKQPSTPPDTAT